MTIQGTGTRETVDINAYPGRREASVSICDNDGDIASVRLDANHLRVLAKLAEAAADELDARSIGP